MHTYSPLEANSLTNGVSCKLAILSPLSVQLFAAQGPFLVRPLRAEDAVLAERVVGGRFCEKLPGSHV
jgi:hypothetical protein